MKTDHKPDPNQTEENLCIPLDLVVDIFGIIVRESIPHEVTEVVESRSLMYVSLYLHKSHNRHEPALQNIQRLLKEYKNYRWDEREHLNWREG